MAGDTATQLVEIFGTYPVSKTFAVTDNVPDLQETEVPAYSAAFDVDPTARRHTACDECSKFEYFYAITRTKEGLRKAQAEMLGRPDRLRTMPQTEPHMPLLGAVEDGTSKKEAEDG